MHINFLLFSKDEMNNVPGLSY